MSCINSCSVMVDPSLTGLSMEIFGRSSVRAMALTLATGRFIFTASSSYASSHSPCLQMLLAFSLLILKKYLLL